MLSTTFGVGIFLVLVTFAAQVLLGLWVRSTVDSIATDAATTVALSGADPATRAEAQAAALARARASLGRHASRVHLEFETAPGEPTVVLRVRSDGVGLLRGLAHWGRLDRRIVVRSETR